MIHRPRINRWTESRRNLIHDPSIKSSLVQPYFVVDGVNIREEIQGMPKIYRESLDNLLDTVKSDYEAGIRAIMLFGVVSEDLKDDYANQAMNELSHLHKAVFELKKIYNDDLVIMTDVCLCTATAHGHCGIVANGEIENDESVEILAKIALSHAKAGADYVCASDMMDGRIISIRKTLEASGFSSTGILAYSVKYASSFYGPFRNAASSSPKTGDRKSHQMDIRSGYKEAIFESKLDQEEGADIIMIKPGLPYLDVVKTVSDEVEKPVAVYNVSGEYAMVMNSAIDLSQRKSMVIEILNSFKRSGADIIVTYHAREALAQGWIK